MIELMQSPRQAKPDQAMTRHVPVFQAKMPSVGATSSTEEVDYPLRATGTEYSKEQNRYLRTERRSSWGRALLPYCYVNPEVGPSESLDKRARRATISDKPSVLRCTLYKKLLVARTTAKE